MSLENCAGDAQIVTAPSDLLVTGRLFGVS
jgi:hypothetical protein